MIPTLLRASLASGSRAAYKSGLHRFRAFILEACATLAVGPTPTASAADLRALLAEPWIVGTFVGMLYMEGLRAGTARSYLQGVQHFATDLDGLPASTHPAVALILKGFTATGPAVEAKRPPISATTLEAMLQALPSFAAPYEAALLKAVFTVAFYGCFRASEYLQGADADKCLRLRDISLEAPGSLVISVKKTKTNQHGPPQQVCLPTQQGISCPVTAMREFLGVRPQSLGPNSALFFCTTRRGPFTAKHLNNQMKKLLASIGVPNAHTYSSHSFRIGAATTAASRGATLVEIQALGRWNSNTALEYISAEVSQTMAVQTRSRLGPSHPASG